MYDASLTLANFDPELADAIQNEEHRQEHHVELIASIRQFDVWRLCEEADFGAQNCQHSTKVDAR